jgi:uncharacterized protein (DUF2141 family)
MSRIVRCVIVVAVVGAACACAVTCARRQRSQSSAPVASTAAPATAPVTAQAAQDGAPLTITVKDLRNHKGSLIFGVFRSADGFPNTEKKSVYWEVKDAAGEAVTFSCRLPPGKYAASVLHDENRSGEMDRGFGGLPLEGYGVTNNPKPKMRAATFNEATFTLPPEGKEMTISPQYQFL